MNIDPRPLRGKRVLCAVSGGADSMCLLHLLHENGIDVIAAHFEHGIRGAESERDLEFVRQYCEGSDIPFIFARGDVPAYAREQGMGIEEAARRLRYEFLERSREELRCHLIATAHNANDNAETMLFNLSRGSGALGLAGIPPRRDNIIRPLLNVTRAEIEAYLEKHSVPHVEDSTNQSEDYTRNLIRRRIMPLMQELNPRFVDSAARTAELMRRDEDYLTRLAKDFIAEHLRGESLNCKELCALHPALSSRVLRELIPGLGAEHVEAVLSFCAARGYGELSVPGRILTRDAAKLWLSPPASPQLSQHVLLPGTELELPEIGLVIHSEICDYMGEVNDLFKTSFVKYEIICSNLRITGRKPGDSLRPLGRGCRKTLKALFMERDYPRHLRDACPILRDDGGIILVHGIAMDERAKPELGKKALKISFEKIKPDTGEKDNAERH